MKPEAVLGFPTHNFLYWMALGVQDTNQGSVKEIDIHVKGSTGGKVDDFVWKISGDDHSSITGKYAGEQVNLDFEKDSFHWKSLSGIQVDETYDASDDGMTHQGSIDGQSVVQRAALDEFGGVGQTLATIHAQVAKLVYDATMKRVGEKEARLEGTVSPDGTAEKSPVSVDLVAVSPKPGQPENSGILEMNGAYGEVQVHDELTVSWVPADTQKNAGRKQAA